MVNDKRQIKKDRIEREIQKYLCGIILFLFFSSLNFSFAQNIKIKTKVVVKAKKQYIEIVVKSDEKGYLDLQFLGETFNGAGNTQVMKYDSVNVEYEHHFNDTVNPLKYFDLPITKLFFIYNNQYIRYFIFDRSSLTKEEIKYLDNNCRYLTYEAPNKRKVYKIPLSINPEILKWKPENIFFSSVLYFQKHYSKEEINKMDLEDLEDLEIIEYNLDIVGRVKYCLGWKKWLK